MHFKFVTITLMGLLLLSCNGAGTANNINLENDTTDDTDDTETTACHESVIDAGSKAAVTAQRRGSFSDVRINPINSREAFAYYDLGALSMKFTYWNGSKYVHELVAGFPTEPNKVSLVFLSSGVPVIAWTSGGTGVYLAIRSHSSTTSESSWSSKEFASVATTARAIKLEVSPNDMVGGLYNTIATNGRMKMILCTSNCSNINNYQNMSGATDFVGNDNNNTAASMVSVGFAWCKAGTDLFYPAAVYGRIAPSNSTRFAVCPNSNPLNCLTGANWTVNSQILSVSPTANISSALHIDASQTNDPPKILSLKTAVGVKAYLSGTGALPVGCRDVVSGTTWDESTETLGGASTGNGWLEIARSNSGVLHAVMNEALTNIRYYNTDSGTLSSWDTFWNTGNGYLNTVTTSGSGGAVLDKTNGILYSSYYVNLAINRFNFLLNKVSSIPTDSANVVSTNTAVNNDGHLSLVTNVTKTFVLAKTSDGEAGVAYVDYSLGANTTGVLKYAHKTSREITSSWSISIIPGVTSPESIDLKFDEQNRPWISYYDRTNLRYFLISNSSVDGSGSWVSYMMPPVGTPAAPTFPAANDTAIAMVNSNDVYKPMLVVLDNTAAGRTVRAAYLDSAVGTWSSVVTVSSIGATGASGLSANGDENGNIGIAFLDRTAGNFLKYVRGHLVSGAPTFTSAFNIGTVTGTGQGTELKFNPVTGSPMVSFLGRSDNRLYLATCSSGALACASTPWTISIQDLFTGISGLSIATTFNEYLASTALTERSDGAFDIFYSQGMGSLGDLKRIKVDANGTATGTSTWVSGVGANLATTLNFGVQGFLSDAEITSGNQLISIFLGRGNLLVQKTCDLDIQD